jgi:hypothetical protein
MTAKHTIAEYTAITNEAERIAKEVGIVESAVDDFCHFMREEIEIVEGQFVASKTGAPMKDFVQGDFRNRKPHMWPAPMELDHLERCFGSKPNLSAQGDLVKQVGLAQAKETARKWGTELASLKPGVRPDGDGTSEQRPARPSNPWSAAGWSLKRQGELVKSMPLSSVAAIARSAGCVIGSTKPNPLFNR